MDRLAPLQTVVIPRWAHQALIANEMAVTDIHNYSKLRQALAVNDIVDIVLSNRLARIDGMTVATQDHPFGMEELAPRDLEELTHSVLLPAGVESSAAYVRGKLTGLSPQGDRYSFDKATNTVYVVIGEGFLAQVDDAEFKLNFVRDYLKQCYSMASVTYVNSHVPLFRTYVKALSRQA